MYCVCDLVIDFDAYMAYKAEDIENLISHLQQLLAENKTAFASNRFKKCTLPYYKSFCSS